MKPNQLSKTAAFIAIKFYGLTQKDHFRSLFDDSVITFYERIVQNLPSPLNYYHYWLKFNWVRKLYMGSEELLLPGDLLHIIARKYYIRHCIKKLTEDGYQQIIVLGAGFDDLAFTYTQKGYSCLEIDVPHMAKHKQEFLNQHYVDSKHPQIMSSYLTNSQLDFPSNINLDPNQKTIIIAEGFFDYLHTGLVDKILRKFKSHLNQNPTLITTHFALDELPFYHQWSFKTGVKTVGEALKLHLSISEFQELLTENGFMINRLLDRPVMTKQLQQLTGTKLPLLKGFYLIQAN
jgi:O-methyltransferase involved in polyketide biosynthesis